MSINDDFWSKERDDEKFGKYGFTKGDFKRNAWMFNISDVRQATTSELMSIDILMNMRDGNIKDVDGKKLHFLPAEGHIDYDWFRSIYLLPYANQGNFFYKGREYKTSFFDSGKYVLQRADNGEIIAESDDVRSLFMKQKFDGDKTLWDVIRGCGFVLKEPSEKFLAAYRKALKK